jgi:serine/threonine protein kinase
LANNPGLTAGDILFLGGTGTSSAISVLYYQRVPKTNTCVPGSNQTVAIKHLKPELTAPELIERFKREGEALRELNHPNIVKMLDAVEENGAYYLIIEYLSGGDLNDLLRAISA